ncbi:hypothetical protein PUN28_016299 [Cardiocondyla obscurior]|uniref:Uncharacterized protein n=1 Tax=Cardiocondyla obscurior TaxID=286306 RepID=A0AAW2EX47_9HYME
MAGVTYGYLGERNIFRKDLHLFDHRIKSLRLLIRIRYMYFFLVISWNKVSHFFHPHQVTSLVSRISIEPPPLRPPRRRSSCLSPLFFSQFIRDSLIAFTFRQRAQLGIAASTHTDAEARPLQKCMYVEALESLLHNVPPNILKYILGQFSKILPHDARTRRLFVTSGGLKKVPEIQTEPGTVLSEYVTIINRCFAEEIVSILETVEQYQPNCISTFHHESFPDDTESIISLSNDER